MTDSIRGKIEQACAGLRLDPNELTAELDACDIADLASGALGAEGLRLVAEHVALHDKEKS